MLNVHEKDINDFKIILLRKMPFYGDILTRINVSPKESVRTAATDGLNIWYNPKYFNSLSVGQCYYVLMHEVMHIILMHCARGKYRDHRIANIAQDMIVNSFLDRDVQKAMRRMDIPFERPQNGIFANIPNSIIMEALYEQIMADNEENVAPKGKVYIRTNYGVGKYDMKTVDTPMDVCNDPSVASSQGIDIYKGDGRENIFNNDESKASRINSIISEALKKNGIDGRSPFGTYPIPKGLMKITEGEVLNWKTILKRFMEVTISSETSYATPERKYLHMDLIIPGHGEGDEVVQNVWAFVDCSGSIGQGEMQDFTRQLYHIVKNMHCVLNIVYWDTAVHEVYREISNRNELEKACPLHSGGTDINCVYEWIKNENVKPDVMIILTDGCFGVLAEQYRSQKLKKKTILVIKGKTNDNFDSIGRVSRL